MVPEVERAIVMARSAKAREAAAREQRQGNAEAADLAQMEARYRDGDYSERDAKYQMQRTHNARRGKGNYDAKLRRGPTGE